MEQGEAKCQTPYPAILTPNSLPETYNFLFTLDVNAPDKPSYMHFGSPDGGWGDMEWSETQPVALLGEPKEKIALLWEIWSGASLNRSRCWVSQKKKEPC